MKNPLRVCVEHWNLSYRYRFPRLFTSKQINHVALYWFINLSSHSVYCTKFKSAIFMPFFCLQFLFICKRNREKILKFFSYIFSFINVWYNHHFQSRLLSHKYFRADSPSIAHNWENKVCVTVKSIERQSNVTEKSLVSNKITFRVSYEG